MLNLDNQDQETIRDNFAIIENRLEDTLILRGRVLSFKVKPGLHSIRHSLGRIPKDIIVTRSSQLVQVDWNKIDREYIWVYVSDECEARILVGDISND